MKNKDSNKEGMTTLEMLVLLSAVGLQTLVGMKILLICLETAHEATAGVVEEAGITGFQEKVSRAIENRLLFSLVEEPCLEIQGSLESGFTDLKFLGIRRVVNGGELDWLEFGMHPTGIIHGYDGRVLTSIRPGSYTNPEIPGEIYFRFPDASTNHLRQGFAIRTDW